MVEFDRIKAHVVRHKVAYTVGGVVVIAGVSFYLGSHFGGVNNKASNKAVFALGDQIINITTVIHRNGRGHPGYPVMNVATKEWWPSARACAEAEGISEKLLASCLKGRISHVKGKTYSWFSLIPTPSR